MRVRASRVAKHSVVVQAVVLVVEVGGGVLYRIRCTGARDRSLDDILTMGHVSPC